MQKNAKNKKNTAQPVYKPYLRGRAASALAAKRGWKVLGMTALFAFLYVLVGSVLTSDNLFLRLVLNLTMVGLACLMMFSEGSRQGENDTAFAEIAQNRLDSGKAVPDSEKDRCFHPLKGFFTALVGISLVFVIALTYALIAHKQTYQLGALPSWVTAFESQSQIGQALAYYQESSPLRAEDVLRVIVRLVLFPFVNLAGVNNYDGLYLVDRLSPLLCLIAPAFYGLGYLRGPSLRAMVHGNIRLNRRRHNRNERKARERRASAMKEKKELI